MNKIYISFLKRMHSLEITFYYVVQVKIKNNFSLAV